MRALPKTGVSRGALFEKMQAMRKHDTNWKEGRTFSLVYYAGEELSNVAKEAYQLFFHENGLNPMAFHSLKTFETEVLSMASSLFHGDEFVESVHFVQFAVNKCFARRCKPRYGDASGSDLQGGVLYLVDFAVGLFV